MSSAPPLRAARQARLCAAAALLAACALTALLLPGVGSGAPAPEAVVAQPLLGTADSETVLMGAAPGGAAGEAWGYRRLPLTVGAVAGGGSPAEIGAPANPAAPDQQLAFLRYTDAAGWRIFQTPLDESGDPYRGPQPNPLAARITPEGGGVLLGRDANRPSGQQVVVLHRNPGGRFQALEPPDAGTLPPGEVLAEDRGAGRARVAAYDTAGSTNLLIAAIADGGDPAVLRYDGSSRTWTREPIAGAPAGMRVTAIGATGPGNAWLVAAKPGGGILLFERAGGSWAERALATSPFTDSGAAATAGIEAVKPLEGNAQALTVTADGMWVDGSLKQSGSGAEHDFTVFVDPDAVDPGTGAVQASWCDAPDAGGGQPCAHVLGASFSRQSGYRSFAWTGGGPFGRRIVTNPLAPDRDEESNRGTYLRLDGTVLVRMPGGGGNRRPSGAFSADDEGWLEGPLHVTGDPDSARRLEPWPVSLRSPFLGAAPAPGAPPGGLGSEALAVGVNGAVARFGPGRGWVPEFLLSSSGAVVKNTLRSVAWPETDRAHAVGDNGAMWLWRKATGLWERDPGSPIGYEKHLMGVAFQPGSPQRGYAVGREGALLRYDKSWEQESLPAGFGNRSFTSVAFAGRQALVAAENDVLTNDGSGWRVDQSVRDLFDFPGARTPTFVAVAGLPDGGAVAAGRDFVIERDSAGAAWRFAEQPLPGSTVLAAGAFREGSRVRAAVAVVPRSLYPSPDPPVDPDPNTPPPLLGAYPLPGDGYLLRETGDGWRDEQRTAYAGSSRDRPVKSDPVNAFVLDAGGAGWALGGWSGTGDTAGRGSSRRTDRDRVSTAAIFRYDPGGAPAGAPRTAGTAIPLSRGKATLALAGHAQCEEPCNDLRDHSLGPDRTLEAALRSVAGLGGRPGGPGFLVYTGGRIRPTGGSLTGAEAARYAELLGGEPRLPVYAAAAAADTSSGGGQAYKQAFAGFAGPFGGGPAPAGVSTAGIPGAAPGPEARTHYAFDAETPGGVVRVIVIDNSAGSLAASDPHQNPAEAQRPWLQAVLADAKAEQIPAVVVGSRDLNSRFRPRLNVATDADDVAKALVDGGASAYFFERPEEQRNYRIPAGAADQIPSYGTGTLGYRSSISGVSGVDEPDSLFGDSGYLLAEIDVAQREAATNRAPVSVRLVPLIGDISLEAVDGVLLRRSRPALFRGLGRRPVGGDRWGRIAASTGNPDPPGADPYINFPAALCRVAGCSARIDPEYEFSTADPDIADFVRQDPNSPNLRKPLIGSDDEVVTDPKSSLLCPFNAGKTTVTVNAGGLSYSQPIEVLAGSVQRPCGTRPLRPDRFKQTAPSGSPQSPPPPAPAGNQPPTFPPPPPPPAKSPPAKTTPKPTIPPAAVVPPLAVASRLPLTFTLPPPPIARPIPPGGAGAMKEKREEEVAPEESQAFARYEPERPPPLALYTLGVVMVAALAGAGLHGLPRERRRAHPAALAADMGSTPVFDWQEEAACDAPPRAWLEPGPGNDLPDTDDPRRRA